MGKKTALKKAQSYNLRKPTDGTLCFQKFNKRKFIS